MAEEGGSVARASLGPPVYVDPTPSEVSPPDWKEWTVMPDPTTGKRRLFLNNHGINENKMWSEYALSPSHRQPAQSPFI